MKIAALLFYMILATTSEARSELTKPQIEALASRCILCFEAAHLAEMAKEMKISDAMMMQGFRDGKKLYSEMMASEDPVVVSLPIVFTSLPSHKGTSVDFVLGVLSEKMAAAAKSIQMLHLSQTEKESAAKDNMSKRIVAIADLNDLKRE